MRIKVLQETYRDFSTSYIYMCVCVCVMMIHLHNKHYITITYSAVYTLISFHALLDRCPCTRSIRKIIKSCFTYRLSLGILGPPVGYFKQVLQIFTITVIARDTWSYRYIIDHSEFKSTWRVLFDFVITSYYGARSGSDVITRVIMTRD